MKLKFLLLLVTTCSAATISRNDVSPYSAQSSGNNEYLPVLSSHEYSNTQNGQRGMPQYLSPQALSQQETNEYLPPVEPKQANPQYTPVSDSVEILNPDFFPSNSGQNTNQYQAPPNPSQQSMEYYQPLQSAMPVLNDNIYGISQNVNALTNQYLPSTDNSKQENNINPLSADEGYYNSNQYYHPYGHNLNSDAYLPPSSVDATANQYISPANNGEVVPIQYTPPTYSAEVVSNQYIPQANSAEIVPSQYIPSKNNAEVVPSQYILPTNNAEVAPNQYIPPTNNAEVISNQYIPPTNNEEVVSNHYLPPPNNVEVVSNQYTPLSNDVEIISNRNAAQNNFGQAPQEYGPQIDSKDNNDNYNYAHQSFNEDFEPQKLVQNDPNSNIQKYNSQTVSNEYLPTVSANFLPIQHNQQTTQQNVNEYLPPVVANSALKQVDVQQNSDHVKNTISISNDYSRDVSSPINQNIQLNNGQNYNSYPLLPTTKPIEAKYEPVNAHSNQYIENSSTAVYLPSTDTKSVPNQYLPVVDVNSQIKQYNDSPVQIKQNSVEYLPPVDNTDKYASSKYQYLPTVSEATRRYDSNFSKLSSVYNFNTISSTPYPYSYTFSTPATISRSRDGYYRSDESARTDRPVFKYSPKLIEIAKSTNSPKWPKDDSFTTPRSFEKFKINPQAQSRQSFVYGKKGQLIANSRSSGVGILSGSQQTDKFDSSSSDHSKFDSSHLNQNHLRTLQPLDSIHNPFQSINQQDSDHSSQKSYSNLNSHYSGHTTESVPILKQMSEMAADGSFSYETLTGDQTHVMQQGHIENLGTDHEEQVIHGSYSYIGDDGKTYTVTYIADANGFRAVGDHIPTPPPVPEVIQRSIEFNLAEEIAKSSSTPGNQYGTNNNQAYSNPEQIRERSSHSKESGYKY